jgi:hypothetical protein
LCGVIGKRHIGTIQRTSHILRGVIKGRQHTPTYKRTDRRPYPITILHRRTVNQTAQLRLIPEEALFTVTADSVVVAGGVGDAVAEQGADAELRLGLGSAGGGAWVVDLALWAELEFRELGGEEAVVGGEEEEEDGEEEEGCGGFGGGVVVVGY